MFARAFVLAGLVAISSAAPLQGHYPYTFDDINKWTPVPHRMDSYYAAFANVHRQHDDGSSSEAKTAEERRKQVTALLATNPRGSPEVAEEAVADRPWWARGGEGLWWRRNDATGRPTPVTADLKNVHVGASPRAHHARERDLDGAKVARRGFRMQVERP